MGEFRMPSLGADMKMGILVEWMVKPGDHVKRGDIIAVVETNKGSIEVEVFEDGVVDQILVQPGEEEIPVGTALATIRSEEKPEVPPTEAGAEAPVERRLRVSPSARQLAAELGVDLDTVRGTGPNGAVSRADVEQAAKKKRTPEEAPASPPAEPTAKFLAGMRKAIAAAMARSNREIPHYYLETHIDMSRAMRWLEAENRKRSVKDRLLPVVLLVKAVALAVGEVPELNGYWIDDRNQLQEATHIGFAIALRQGGLVTPAIHNAKLKSLGDIMEAMRDLIPRARAGRLRSSEITDATITVTNLGDLGVKTVYGVIYPPQVALVGFGKITDQAWVEKGMLGIRPILTATLAADHRATDGHLGARFLEALNRYLQEPEKL
jgi:pyruvate dehydrogenase E2 component (dihydrolipoamide acetyltransferase)